MTFVYMAGPYSSQDPAIRHQRFIAHCRAAAYLIERGIPVFSPICQSHPIAEVMERERDHHFWMEVDLPLLAASDRLIVLKLPGWQVSRGVREEMDYARNNSIPVEYMEPL